MSLALLGGLVGAGIGAAGAGERQRMLRGLGRQNENEVSGLREQLQRRMSGQDSLVGMQLKDALGRAQAGAASMAAGASPIQGGVARRQAMQQQGTMAGGAVGQGVMAAVADRQAATQQLQQFLQQQQENRMRLMQMKMQQPTAMEQWGGGAMGLGKILGM